ncbi:unnamed protein product [Discosporangium mesarthrocarpum]
MSLSRENCSRLRGLYDKDDDDAHPLVDNTIFKLCPEGMRFDTKEECKKFVEEQCLVGSNPDYPWMQQIFTTLVTWSQLEQYLFPRLRAIWKTIPFRRAGPLDLDPQQNVFLRQAAVDGGDEEWPLQHEVVKGVRRRLDLPFHGGGVDGQGMQKGALSYESTANSFRC